MELQRLDDITKDLCKLYGEREKQCSDGTTESELDLEKIFNLIRNTDEWKVRLVGEYAYLSRNIARLENALRSNIFYKADKNEDYIKAL